MSHSPSKDNIVAFAYKTLRGLYKL